MTSTADHQEQRRATTSPPAGARRSEPQIGLLAETFPASRSREELRRKAELARGDKQLSTQLLQALILLTSLEPPAGTYAGHQASRKRLEGTTSLAPVLLRSFVLYAMLPGDGRYVNATDLAWGTALPRPTTVKILKTLAALELIERAPNANHFRRDT